MPIGSLSIHPQFTVKGCSLNQTGTSPSSRSLLNFSKFTGEPSSGRSLSRRLSLRNGNGGFTLEPHGVGDRDGIIIVDHGSRRKESNLMLNEFVAMFREKTGYQIVEPAHMELAEPSIRNSFDACVQKGANRVIVSPFFLFPGRHWHQDIPSLTAEAAKQHPDVSYIVTAPLGLHELLVVFCCRMLSMTGSNIA
ncbi:sirohydrochlorin ferrochelatase, chloroplastic isoform X2 [Ziziphus jujuba]|uniref:Sirohydrochlorin ferrochelatase, chloroplastic isoform X2 n=1 Tax=Ziziphus jujuba TaxID=326968 RepID=A0A6P6G308_ZIZJJ|nr:sirohydrochlorin ferrochelatase, chloroplastic isoform X2 [Ziziphus jujuba]